MPRGGILPALWVEAAFQGPDYAANQRLLPARTGDLPWDLISLRFVVLHKETSRIPSSSFPGVSPWDVADPISRLAQPLAGPVLPLAAHPLLRPGCEGLFGSFPPLGAGKSRPSLNPCRFPQGRAAPGAPGGSIPFSLRKAAPCAEPCLARTGPAFSRGLA